MKVARESLGTAAVAAPPERVSRRITVVRDGFPARPGLDTALSRALLLHAGEGRLGETFRLHAPADLVAFGRRDAVTAGYPAAVAAARHHGFVPVERITGGRAAVFHGGTLAFSWTLPQQDPAAGIHARFSFISELVATALRDLGVPAHVGEVPGEYCPGRYSVNVAGRIKVMGVGQRLARHAAHVGGVVVVGGGRRIREVLVPVYAALGLAWEPATAGALEDEEPGITVDDVAEALLDGLASAAHLEEGTLHPDTVHLAERLLPDHVVA